jgi:leader peptidase (prepilin peptidase)/N-methyltransferase
VCIVLIVTGAIDWTHRFIYTFVILGAAVLALLAHLVAPDTMPGMDGLDALIGMIAAGIAFMLLYLLANIMFPGKSVPFGMGDVFLAVFIGAAVGMHRLAPTLVYGMLMAGVVAGGIVIGKYALRRRDMPEYMPYGTYLCLGAIVYLLVNGW